MAKSSESPLLRRKRDAAVANQQCIEVQWRFLQHRNPIPPQFVHSPRRDGLGVPNLSPMRPLAPSSSSSRLAQLFAQEPSRVDGRRDSITDGNKVVQDLMGETQRQAMMDRILAEMKALVIADTTAKLPPVVMADALHSPRSSDEDDDELAFKAQRQRRGDSVLARTLRSSMSIVSAYDGANEGSTVISLLPQRRLSQLAQVNPFESSDDDDFAQNEDDEDDDDRMQDEDDQGTLHITSDRRLQKPSQSTWGPRINLQKTTRTQIAVDLPASLSPPRLLGRQASRPPPLAVVVSDGEIDAAAIRPHSLTEPTHNQSRSRRRYRRRRQDRASIPFPGSNQYGSAWYLPRTQWWPRHAVDWTPPPDTTPHCHHTTAAHPRHQKPTVVQPAFPSQPLMAPSGASPSSAAGHQNGRPILPAAPSSSASATSGVIPHSFIGREYRQFILAQGSPMPPYLQPH